MGYKVLALVCLTFAVTAASVINLKSDPVGPVLVHATGNQSVPSVDYIVNAVQSLKQAIEVFPDEQNTVKMYSALFKTKYPAHNWNVAVGYSTLFINSSIYVECSVSSGGKNLYGSLKSDKKKGVAYMIFSTD